MICEVCEAGHFRGPAWHEHWQLPLRRGSEQVFGQLWSDSPQEGAKIVPEIMEKAKAKGVDTWPASGDAGSAWSELVRWASIPLISNARRSCCLSILSSLPSLERTKGLPPAVLELSWETGSRLGLQDGEIKTATLASGIPEG